jgi:hypothetical protein
MIIPALIALLSTPLVGRVALVHNLRDLRPFLCSVQLDQFDERLLVLD